MDKEVAGIIRECPELLVFLALALGYLIGKLKIKGFGLGTTASVLLAAMILGQITIEVPSLLKNISFALFAFCIGYQVGPQFFGSLRKEAFNYIWIALIVALAGLGTAIVLGKLLHFDSGTTAGLFAGAMTQSAAIGTAQGAVAVLPLSDAAKALLNGNIAVAYAITYLFGTVGVIIFFKMLPGFMRLDLKEEARKLEEQMGGASDLSRSSTLFSWSQQVELRAYEATNERIFGKTVSEVESSFLPARVSISRIKRGGNLIEVSADTTVEPGDIIVVASKHMGLIHAHDMVGHEIDVSAVIDMTGESLDVCVLNPDICGKSLLELAEDPNSRGLFLRRITRQGQELPIAPGTVINKCDVLQLLGEKSRVELAATTLGYAQRLTSVTDMVMVGIGCVLGTLVGLIAVRVGAVSITLGVGGGVLVAGLVFGWLRSLYPVFGQIPEGGQWILNDLGLNLFIACIGLASGKQAVEALQANGMTVFFAGVVLALLPIVVGLLFGKYLLRMNPVLLMGALTGARVIPGALNTLEEEAESSMLVLGFAAPFAFANVFLTVMGSLIINLM